MQTGQSQVIIKRFFDALQILIDNKVIRGKQTFATRYGINRRNMYTLEKEPGRDIFQVAWLENLVTDYMVSPVWLLTGNGSFFINGWDADRVKSKVKTEQENCEKLQENCKSKNDI
nr:MAG: helix-turn-helix domain protein [Bacteriophage sp.]